MIYKKNDDESQFPNSMPYNIFNQEFERFFDDFR